jgi:GDPmannose 4,6-dehydratase
MKNALTMPTKALICGISGQDGAYLASLLLQKGYAVYGTSRDAQISTFGNLARLGIREQVSVSSMVLTDFRSVLQTLSQVEPDEIYNLAGQSSVGLSFQQPVETLESITIGTLNLLESIRFLGRPMRLYNAGSSECFGDTGNLPANEQTPFHPRSPYAVAKAAAHWEVANYRDAYGLFACSGILFNHESPLRPERFVTRKIISSAVRIAAGRQEKLTLGNLDIQRDWGWAPEYVEAMWLMLQQDRADDFVIATGETHSLRDFCAATFAQLGLEWQHFVEIDESLYRPAEIMVGQADPAQANNRLHWQARTTMPCVIERMIGAEKDGNGTA